MAKRKTTKVQLMMYKTLKLEQH